MMHELSPCSETLNLSNHPNISTNMLRDQDYHLYWEYSLEFLSLMLVNLSNYTRQKEIFLNLIHTGKSEPVTERECIHSFTVH
jgi:hypothetical protein